jgi:phosphoglycolate phosphatase-like HAD superfamily hydrolase
VILRGRAGRGGWDSNEVNLAKRIDTLKAIAFDFDGVILESQDIKTEAFVELFAKFPGQLEEIRKYHLDNAGISRYVKFEHISREILGLPYTETDRERLGAEFSQLVYDRIIACPEVNGARDLLRGLRPRVLRVVASGTPQDELRRIVHERRMTEWFDEVWGTPRTKTEILRDLLARHALAPGQVLMVGDARSDYQAAQETGLKFLARELGSVFTGMNVAKVTDLGEMAGWLEGEET